MTANPPRIWANDKGGYIGCSHVGCKKKADLLNITDHYCCGRCSAGRSCLNYAQEHYAGPGVFAHRYTESPLHPGICMVCRGLPDAHQA